MREKYRIMVFGDVEEVYLSFFEVMEVIGRTQIGDTWFFEIANGEESLFFSIHENYWQKVLAGLRGLKISKILE